MRTYKEFHPTPFDPKGLGLSDRQSWVVGPCLQTRDSDPLEESNFVSLIKALGGESETVEVHRFGHWGPGWFEVVLVHPSRADEVQALEERLDVYPVLDEDDWSRRETEAAEEAWTHLSLKERVGLCIKARVSIFAARHDYPPENDNGAVYEYLLGY